MIRIVRKQSVNGRSVLVSASSNSGVSAPDPFRVVIVVEGFWQSELVRRDYGTRSAVVNFHEVASLSALTLTCAPAGPYCHPLDAIC